MGLDSTFLKFLCRELRDNLIDGKVEKIQQPGRSEIIFTVKTNRGRKNVFLGGASGSARINITNLDYEKPQEPPMFCMLLRKHLVGAKITNIAQPENERIVLIDFDAPGKFGEGEKRELILELFGRTANIVLTDGKRIITDCLYRVGSIEDERMLQPGVCYRFPKKQDKTDILKISDNELMDMVNSANEDMPIDKWLISRFYGFSPLTSREMCYRICSDISAPFYRTGRENIFDNLVRYRTYIEGDQGKAYMVTDTLSKPLDFSYIPIKQYGDGYVLKEISSFSECLEIFWGQKNEDDRRRQRASSLIKTVKNLRDRTERRLFSQRNELLSSEDREYLRECGDIITSNLHLMKKGMSVLKAYDYYSADGGEREIKLDPLKTPQQNAAKYYKDYTRAKSAELHLTEQIEKGEQELRYLESVLEELRRAETERDVLDIKAELVGAGVIRETNQKKRVKTTSPGPMVFTSSSGLTIRVGRNNVQNDALTLKNSSKTDLWLHANEIPGSHVIISCEGKEPDEKSILEAASLAAYYSQGRDSGKVPVSYTLVKYVKKPNGAKPGMVIYTNYKTIAVEPKNKIG